MKRFFKLVPAWAFLVCVITCAIALVLVAPPVKAEAASMSGFEYVDVNGDIQTTDDLAEAISGAMKGTRVVKLLGDTECIAAGSAERIVLVTGAVEIDLCGYTLSVSQGGISNPGRRRIEISGSASLTVKNGTIRVRRIDSGNEGNSYPLFYFRDSKSGGVLNLENVNTYSGALIYANKSTDSTVNVTGGEHHVTLGYDDTLTNGGFVDACTTMAFTAKDASFFADKSSYVVASTSVNTTSPSTFTFTNCKLISDPEDNDGTYTLAKNISDKTTLCFNDCDIYGSILANNVVLGKGTRISNAMIINNYTVDGGTLNASPATEIVAFKGCADDLSEGFSFSTISVACRFTHEVGATASSCTVEWYDENGTLISTEKVTRGGTATPPERKTPENIDNGWVRIEFDGGWSHTLYGAAVDMTVTEDTKFYPSASLCRAYLKAMMHNLSLYGNVTMNAYLPLETAPDGIELVEFVDAEGGTIVKNDTTLVYDSVRYAWYTIGSVGAIELGKELNVSVKFLYNGIEFSQTFALSPAKYAETVLSSTTSYADAKQMVADMIIYSNSIWQYVNATNENDPALDELITAYSDLATPAGSVSSESFIAGSLGNYEALQPYVSSLTFDVTAYEPCYLLKFYSTARVKDVRFVTSSGVTYTMSDETAEYGSDGYLVTARSIGMSLYYIDSKVDIILTVVDENGEEQEVRGSYTLNDYYNGVYPSLNAQLPEFAARLDALMRALRAYAASALAYKNR